MSVAWLIYIASGIVIVWGVGHIVPTAAVVTIKLRPLVLSIVAALLVVATVI
jgi:hypothetical protein